MIQSIQKTSSTPTKIVWAKSRWRWIQQAPLLPFLFPPWLMAFLFQSMTPALMNANALIAFTAATQFVRQDPKDFFQGNEPWRQCSQTLKVKPTTTSNKNSANISRFLVPISSVLMRHGTRRKAKKKRCWLWRPDSSEHDVVAKNFVDARTSHYKTTLF